MKISLGKVFVAGILFMMIAGNSAAQRPVDLPIPNIRQETKLWCWAAVAQQIISATVGPQRTPPQCALVAIAYGSHPDFCCSYRNPQCIRTGSLPQIQYLITRFGGRYSSIAPPANPMTLYRTLASGRAVILHVRTGFSSSHVVVLRGMSLNGRQPLLYINDPMSYFTQPVPFSRLVHSWIEAIVVN